MRNPGVLLLLLFMAVPGLFAPSSTSGPEAARRDRRLDSRGSFRSALSVPAPFAPVPFGMVGLRADTLTVCPEGCAFAPIQEALERANPGDTIRIEPGTYEENLLIAKKQLVLRGADPQRVIIRAKFPDEPVVLLRESDVRISSVTLSGGVRGIQIKSRGENPALSNLIIRDNRAEGVLVEGIRRCAAARSFETPWAYLPDCARTFAS